MAVYQIYLELKEKHPDAIVFFRIGDFFETFGEDAKTAGQELDIVVTSRKLGDNLTPMAGFPYFSAERYFGRLIEAGYKIAVCEKK